MFWLIKFQLLRPNFCRQPRYSNYITFNINLHAQTHGPSIPFIHMKAHGRLNSYVHVGTNMHITTRYTHVQYLDLCSYTDILIQMHTRHMKTHTAIVSANVNSAHSPVGFGWDCATLVNTAHLVPVWFCVCVCACV